MPFWSRKPRTHTNAPPHWPAVQLDHNPLSGINLSAAGVQLAPLHAPPKSSIAFKHDFLYKDGILRVPILVEEKGVKRGVFVYSSEDRNAAAHYAGVRALLKSRENIAAVYYGPETLAPTTPADVLQPIDTRLFSRHVGSPGTELEFAL